jgi:hypothetical protein
MKRDLSLIIFNTFGLCHVHSRRCAWLGNRSDKVISSVDIETQIKSISEASEMFFLLICTRFVREGVKKKCEVKYHLNYTQKLSLLVVWSSRLIAAINKSMTCQLANEDSQPIWNFLRELYIIHRMTFNGKTNWLFLSWTATNTHKR